VCVWIPRLSCLPANITAIATLLSAVNHQPGGSRSTSTSRLSLNDSSPISSPKSKVSHWGIFYKVRKDLCSPLHVFLSDGRWAARAAFGLPFVGHHHSGLDDCKTIVQAVRCLINLGRLLPTTLIPPPMADTRCPHAHTVPGHVFDKPIENKNFDPLSQEWNMVQ